MEQEREGHEGLNYVVTKNEEKMGLHGSFTTEILYENTVAHMIGKQKEGFLYMINLMNSARLAVSAQALVGIENALAYARGYAQERQQFGKPIAELPLMKRNLEDYETERDALRALITDTLSHYDIYRFYDRKKGEIGGDLTKEEEEDSELTPLFEGESYEEREDSYYALEDSNDDFYNTIKGKLLSFISLWYFSSGAETADFEQLDKDIEEGNI